MNKKSCLYGNFISIYILNRTLHGRLGIRILSSRAESISRVNIVTLYIYIYLLHIMCGYQCDKAVNRK